MNRSLNDMDQMLIESVLPKTLWAEGVSTAVYVRNRCLCDALGGNLLCKKWTSETPAVSHFQTFVC